MKDVICGCRFHGTFFLNLLRKHKNNKAKSVTKHLCTFSATCLSFSFSNSATSAEFIYRPKESLSEIMEDCAGLCSTKETKVRNFSKSDIKWRKSHKHELLRSTCDSTSKEKHKKIFQWKKNSLHSGYIRIFGV